ncbi:MAG: MBL fold metallo-hydrolase, partial [Deltaproteobacteria bacterium]|nr:MBL fold metallo-hydrolase [Deltaproteobacteria bacterium]
MLIKPFPKTENIHALAIPFVGYSDLITANLYVLGKGPVTLVDTGPKLPGALEFIQDRLNSRGLDFEDIERIIITHGHVDHFGLAAGIRTAVDRPIPCLIHLEDQWQTSGDFLDQRVWMDRLETIMALGGLPREEVEKIKKRFASFREMIDPLDKLTILKG